MDDGGFYRRETSTDTHLPEVEEGTICQYSHFCGNDARYIIDNIPMCSKCAWEATYDEQEAL